LNSKILEAFDINDKKLIEEGIKKVKKIEAEELKEN
jgi:hypothetical protein